MLEETLKSVKDAEAKAEEVIKDADAKAASILEEAKAKAQAMKEDTAKSIRSASQKMRDAAKAEGDVQLQEAENEAKREIEALKELIIPKKPEVVKAVISELV